MKRIPLRARSGIIRAYALVDDADFQYLSQWRWSFGQGYVRRGVWVDGKCEIVQMHCQLMGFPSEFVDHKNGDPLDNQRSNLRLSTHQQNNHNRHKAHARSTTGIRGVQINGNRWSARVTLDGTRYNLGTYDTPEEAGEVAATFRREHMPFSEMDHAA